MAILDLYLCPNTSKVLFASMCEHLSISGLIVVGDMPKWTKNEGSNKTQPIFFSNKRQLDQNQSFVLSCARQMDVVVFLSEVNLYLGDDLPRLCLIENMTEADFGQAMRCAIERPRDGLEKQLHLLKPIPLDRELANKSMGNSVLHDVQMIMYRVPKHDRDEVRRVVISYLAYDTDQLGKAGQYPSIVNLLTQDNMNRLRSASRLAKTVGVAEAAARMGVDKFDLTYLVTSINKSERDAEAAKIKKPSP